MTEANETVELLKEIKSYLSSIDEKLTTIKNDCAEIKTSVSIAVGQGQHNLTDIFEKLSDIDFSVDIIKLSI